MKNESKTNRRTLKECIIGGGLKDIYFLHVSRGYQVKEIIYNQKTILARIQYIGENSPLTERPLEELINDYETPLSKIRPTSFNAWSVH